MKILLLARHAKSDWNSLSNSDFERPLNSRGENDAPLMSGQLRQSGVTIDQIVSSDAKRAISTAQHYHEALAPRQPLHSNHDLYLASSNEIQWIAQQLDNNCSCIMLVGHNPGMTDVVNDFCHTGIENLPTCGIAIVQFDVNDWKDISDKNAHLLAFEYPKKYR